MVLRDYLLQSSLSVRILRGWGLAQVLVYVRVRVCVCVLLRACACMQAQLERTYFTAQWTGKGAVSCLTKVLYYLFYINRYFLGPGWVAPFS